MQYHLLPNKPRNGSDCPFVTWKKVFDDNEIDRILAYASSLEKIMGIVGLGDDGVFNHEIRKSTISWIHNNQESSWIWERMAYVIRDVCSHWYGYNLAGFMDGIQYSEYYEDGGHYGWHLDSMGDGVELQRKLSMTVQLSDPSEYEGGNLELFIGRTPTAVDKEKGLGAIFPSFRLHRVTPVTSGIRKSLVLWANGPSFI